MWRVYAGAEAIDRMGYVIEPEVEQSFRDYMMQENRGKAAQFTPEMRRTYWYYVRHINPDGAQVNV
jgi:pyruvate-formate lyase